MAQKTLTLKLSLAWWFVPLIWALTPLGWLGLSIPDSIAERIASKAAKVERV